MTAAFERGFSRRSTMAGIALLAMAGPAIAAAPLRVREKTVLVATPDGSAEAALAYPAGKGKWPALLLWPDSVGLRALYRGLARRFASEGFVVLVPNSFYRSMRPSEAEPDPSDPAFRAMLTHHRGEASDEGIARDSRAYLEFLDSQPATDRRRKAGTIGYDLGASYAFRAAAALPERIAAVASIYGVSVAASRPTSPHLLVPRTRASYFVAIARDHDAREPDDKTQIKDVIASARLSGDVEVYPADQGWANPASRAYDPGAAERAYQAILKLLKKNLR